MMIARGISDKKNVFEAKLVHNNHEQSKTSINSRNKHISICIPNIAFEEKCGETATVFYKVYSLFLRG